MLASSKTLMIIEGLKGIRVMLSSLIIGFSIESTLRLLKHGDNAVRCNVWRTLCKIDEFDNSLLSDSHRQVMKSAFLAEASLDVIQAGLRWMGQQPKSDAIMLYFSKLLDDLIEEELVSHHPVLLRELLKISDLINPQVIDRLVKITSVNINWAAIWVEIEKNYCIYEVNLEGMVNLLQTFLSAEDINVVYAGLLMTERLANSLGDRVLNLQHLIGKLLSHEDSEIRFRVLSVFFQIMNSDNWEKIMDLILEQIGGFSKLDGEEFSRLSVLEELLRRLTIYAEGKVEQWAHRIIMLVPESASASMIYNLAQLIPKDIEISRDIRNSRFGILAGLVGDESDEDYILRKKFILHEVNPSSMPIESEGLFEHFSRLIVPSEGSTTTLDKSVDDLEVVVDIFSSFHGSGDL